MPERTYLLTVGVIALIFIVSMTIPFASILIGAVLLRHARWKEIVPGIEPGQCDRREPPIGLGAEERMVDTKAMEVVVEEGDRLV